MNEVTSKSDPAPSIPVSQLDTRVFAQGDRFAIWRESFAPLFDVQCGTGVDARRFFGFIRAYTLPDLMIAESCCPSATIWRGRRGACVSADETLGDDPLVLHLHQDGNSRGRNGSRDMCTQRGDISLTDLARTYMAVDDGYRSLSLVIPRTALLPRLEIAGGPGGLVLPAASPLASILASHIDSVWRVLPRLGVDEAPTVAAGLIAAVAYAFGPAVRGLHEGLPEQGSVTFALVAERVERDLHLADLGPKTLCRTFGCSRSQLYRLFAPLGGIAGYISERRMMRGWRLLTRAISQQARIGDIAYQCGFPEQGHFARLFRARWGMSPREAQRHGRERGARPPSPIPVDLAAAYTDWFGELRGSGFRPETQRQ